MNATPSVEKVLKALSDSTRLRITFLLREAGELCVCDLQAVLGISQPKISRHLKVLRDESLVLDRRQGTWIHYRINEDLPSWVRELLAAALTGAGQFTPYREDRAAFTSLKAGEACMDSDLA
ncbi:MAG: metalloregulator ArsR/SmtB family transcription factor [Gammaproteobacteria bacterium]